MYYLEEPLDLLGAPDFHNSLRRKDGARDRRLWPLIVPIYKSVCKFVGRITSWDVRQVRGTRDVCQVSHVLHVCVRLREVLVSSWVGKFVGIPGGQLRRAQGAAGS